MDGMRLSLSLLLSPTAIYLHSPEIFFDSYHKNVRRRYSIGDLHKPQRVTIDLDLVQKEEHEWLA